MAKEITLDELASSVTNENKINTTTPEVVDTPTPEPVPTSPEVSMGANVGGQVISSSELGSRLRSSHNLPENNNSGVEQAPLVKNAFNSMYSTVADRKERIETEFMPIVEENAREMALAKEMGEDIENTYMPIREDTEQATNFSDNGETTIDDITEEDDIIEEPDKTNENKVESPDTNKESKKSSKITTIELDDDDDEDLDSLLDDLDDENDDLDNDEEETAEEVRTRFKETLTSVNVTKDPIDLSKFKIRQSATSGNAILSTVNNKLQNFKKADWALYHTGRSMTFVECRGPELDSLRKTISNSNNINGVIASLRFIYNHTIDANKPDFEAWCKLIRTEDVESLYFGLYRACYADTNLVARACVGEKGCNKTSLIDTPINDMVKFENDEVKDKFNKILSGDTTTPTNTFESELLQISDNFVISYSPPSLYSTFIQYATLSQNITDKYSDTLNTMAYIDGFFNINKETMELIPMSFTKYKNNINKTTISKLKMYIEILKTLNNDQYNIMIAKLNNLIQNPKVTYIYPKAECPECGAELAEENIDSVLNLVFTRAQLVQVKSL